MNIHYSGLHSIILKPNEKTKIPVHIITLSNYNADEFLDYITDQIHQNNILNIHYNIENQSTDQLRYKPPAFRQRC